MADDESLRREGSEARIICTEYLCEWVLDGVLERGNGPGVDEASRGAGGTWVRVLECTYERKKVHSTFVLAHTPTSTSLSDPPVHDRIPARANLSYRLQHCPLFDSTHPSIPSHLPLPLLFHGVSDSITA